VPFAQRALELWRALSDECGEQLLVTTGGVDHGPSDIIDEIEVGLRGHGATSTRLTADEAQERWPGMRFADSVLLQPDAGRIDADATVHALYRRAAELGADIYTGEPVTALRVGGGGVEIVTAERTLRAGVVVVAAGAWLPTLMAQLDLAGELPALTVTQGGTDRQRQRSLADRAADAARHLAAARRRRA
jgi:sarcosine oxidase